MTDRDFKLLVREYFQRIDRAKKGEYKLMADPESVKVEKAIRAELSRFTQQEIEELPFTTNNNER